MELGKLALVCLLACCLVPTASGVCFNGTLSVQELAEMKSKGCSNAGEKLHVKQDGKLVYYLACSPVFTCAKGTYAFVDVKKCRVICKICEENYFQSEEMKTEEFLLPGCRNEKHGCDQDTKMTCWPNSPEQDDMCHCDWRKGYRPQNDSCRHGCYTERDKNCGLCVNDSSCKEGEELNETYHCVPSMVKPCTASQDLNGSNTPGLGTWKIVAIAFIVFFVCCIIIIIIISLISCFRKKKKRQKNKKGPTPIEHVAPALEPQSQQGDDIPVIADGDAQRPEGLISRFRRRQKNKNGPTPIEHVAPAPEPQNPGGEHIPMMAVGDTQRPEGNEAQIAELSQKIKELELENKALLKKSRIQMHDCDKSVMVKDGQKKEMMIVDMPEDDDESTSKVKKHPHKNKHQKRTLGKRASGDEMEALVQKDSSGKRSDQDSSTGHGDVATSSSHYGGEQKLPVAVSKRCVEVESATGGTDDDQELSSTPSSAQSSITGGSSCM